MAGKRKRSTTYKRRKRTRYRRRKRGRKRATNVIPYKGPFPQKWYCKQVYFEKGFTINPAAAGVPAFHVFKLNSAFDPDSTGVGHQPRGFDQLTGHYDNYEVISAKITIYPTSGDATLSTIWTLGLNSESAWANNSYLPENPSISWAIDRVDNRQSMPRKMTKKCNIAKFLGRKEGDDTLYSSIGSDPNQLVYAIVGIESVGTADPGNHTFSIYIQQWVKFFDLKTINPS